MGENKKENVVVILGAGFSKAVIDSFPLMKHLGKKILDLLLEEDKKKLPPVYKDIGFEKWITFITEPQPYYNKQEKLESSLLAYKITNAISRILTTEQAKVFEEKVKIQKWFWSFIHVLHLLQAKVITLNYDNLIEYGIDELKLPRPLQLQNPHGDISLTPIYITENDILDGLPEAIGYDPRSVMNLRMSNSQTILPPYKKTFKLYKLHGSLCWYWLEESKANSLIRCCYAHNHKDDIPAGYEPFIAPPLLTKNEILNQEPLMQKIWIGAKESIERADRIAIIGYSLPEADFAITGLLSTRIMRDNVKDVEIEIINPYPDEICSRLRSFGWKEGNTQPYKNVKDWTDQEIKKFADIAYKQLCSDIEEFSETEQECRLISGNELSGHSGLLRLKEEQTGNALTLERAGTGEISFIAYSELKEMLSISSRIEIEGGDIVIDCKTIEPHSNATRAIYFYAAGNGKGKN